VNRHVDLVSALGPEVAKRVEPFGDGRRYVRAGEWARILAWVVDFVVVVIGFVIGVVVLVMVDQQVALGNGAVGLGVLGLVVGVPLVYGMFYGNGRALGAVLTGTQLVRLKDGGRVGFWGPWAMFVRLLLLPLIVIGAVVGSFGGGGSSPPGSLRRVSLDLNATHHLWAADSGSHPIV
jgi:RDD family